MSLNKQVCLNIREIRNRLNLSQASVANELNVERSTYSKIELGKTELTIDMIEKLSKVFQVDVLEIIGGKSSNINNVRDNSFGNFTVQGVYATLTVNFPKDFIEELKNKV